VRCGSVESWRDGIKTEGLRIAFGMSLAAARVAGQVVSGVEAA
jgi:hypothetical protein